MTALPAVTAFTDSSVTEGQFKTAITDLRAFLAECLGAVGGEISGPGVVRPLVGTAAVPSFSFSTDTDTGLFSDTANELAFSTGGVERARLLASGVGMQYSKGSGDAVAFAERFRKARGSVGAPSVITTGDDLGTIEAYGYVGAANQYVEAARILFDSEGAISDAANGIGGVIAFLTRAAGAGLTEAGRFTSANKFLLGTTAPGTARSRILETGALCLELTSSDADAANKTGAVSVSRFTNAETPFCLIRGQSSSTQNAVTIGGGGGTLAPSTLIQLFTAALSGVGGTGTEGLRVDASQNVGINGTSVFGTNAVGVLGIKNGTAPTTGPADTVQFYSSDDAAGHTIPSFFCEGTNVVATGQADSVSSVRVKMRINGTVRTFLCI